MRRPPLGGRSDRPPCRRSTGSRCTRRRGRGRRRPPRAPKPEPRRAWSDHGRRRCRRRCRLRRWPPPRRAARKERTPKRYSIEADSDPRQSRPATSCPPPPAGSRRPMCRAFSRPTARTTGCVRIPRWPGRPWGSVSKRAPEGVDVIGAELLECQIPVKVLFGGAADRISPGNIDQQLLTSVNEPIEASRDAEEMDARLERHGQFGHEIRSDHTGSDGQILHEPVAEFTPARKVEADTGSADLVHILAPPDRARTSVEPEPVVCS